MLVVFTFKNTIFLLTYQNLLVKSYPYNIQRADSIRYFILHHYGGAYMDLDIGCRRRVDPLLHYPNVLAKTIPVGVSNDLMFSERKSSFMESVIHNLQTFNHKYFTHYATVMFSTGPMFISTIYGLWLNNHPNVTDDKDAVRVIPKSLYGKNAKLGTASQSFFDHYYGSSWHAGDAGFITFLGRWGRGLLIIGGFILFIGIVRLLFYRRILVTNNHQYPPPTLSAYFYPETNFDFGNSTSKIPLLPFNHQNAGPSVSRPGSPSRAPQPSNRIPAILYYPFNPSTWASPTLPQTPLSNINYSSLSNPNQSNGILSNLLSLILPKSWFNKSTDNLSNIIIDDQISSNDDYDDEYDDRRAFSTARNTPYSHHRSTTLANEHQQQQLQQQPQQQQQQIIQQRRSSQQLEHNNSNQMYLPSRNNSTAQQEIESILASLEPQLKHNSNNNQ